MLVFDFADDFNREFLLKLLALSSRNGPVKIKPLSTSASGLRRRELAPRYTVGQPVALFRTETGEAMIRAHHLCERGRISLLRSLDGGQEGAY